MKNWLLKLVMSVLAGLLVWFLTQSDHSPFSGPDVEITDLTLPESIQADQQFNIAFRVTNKRDKTERGCEGFVKIRPADNDQKNLADSDDAEDADGSSNNRDELIMPRSPATPSDTSAFREALSEQQTSNSGPRAPMDRQEVRSVENIRQIAPGDDALQRELRSATERLAVPPHITDLRLPRPVVTRSSACQTMNPEFDLGELSGSSVEIRVGCIVPKQGVFRMNYGIRCGKDNGQWQADHQDYIDVE